MEDKRTITTTEELITFIRESDLTLNQYCEIVEKFFKLDARPWIETTEGQSLEMTSHRKERFIIAINECEQRIEQSGDKIFMFTMPRAKENQLIS